MKFPKALLRILLTCSYWGLLFIFACSLVGANHSNRPNIVFILADDLGYSDLGCYGGEISTPHLDALAKGGLRYTQFYNTGRCWPTRAAILSGYYPQSINRDMVSPDDLDKRSDRPEWARLLPEWLRGLGYLNYQSGKWHMDGDVLVTGFDRSDRTENGHSYFKPIGTYNDDVELIDLTAPEGYYKTAAIADFAIDTLKEHAEDHPEKPFFHYICFLAPHHPLHALPEDIEKYKNIYQRGWDAMRSERHARLKALGIVDHSLPPINRNLGPRNDMTQTTIEQLGPDEVAFPLPWNSLSESQQAFQARKMAIHAAMVDRMDQEIGRIVDQLKAMGAFDNTLIFFASDNGASSALNTRGKHNGNAAMGSAETYLSLGPGFSTFSNTPFRKHKSYTHEGGIATPLIVHWPNGIDARGDLRHSPTHVIDIVPTLMDILDTSKPSQFGNLTLPQAPGISFSTTFEEDQIAPRKNLWWYHEGHRAIRVDDWKLVSTSNEPWELYNLASDRTETNNLAQNFPEKVQEMKSTWQTELNKTIQDRATSVKW